MTLHADLKKSIRRLEEYLGRTAKRASKAASPAAAQDTLADTRETVDELLREHTISADRVPETRDALIAAGKDLPRTYPVATVLVALGIGVMVGPARK